MSNRHIISALAIAATLAGGQAWSQSRLQFEVASVKPSATPPTHLAYVMNDAKVDLGFISPKILIQMAYKVEPYQISGPEWIATARFDILARLPDGANKTQIPEMLQSLLETRFGLASHRESKEQQVYALLPGKDGPKMKDGAADNSHPDLSFLNGRRLLTKLSTEDGFWTISQLDTRRTFDAARITMPELARTLMSYVEDPVVDLTGLKGAYQVSLEVPLDLRAVQVLRDRGVASANTDPVGGVSIFASVQKLGLTLEHRKAPVEHLIVDHMEKVPVEN